MIVDLTTLANGLRVASETMPGVESVAVSVAIGVGSRFESQAENGLSHILEHMAFKGTKTRNAKQIAEAFEDIGGQFNAYTSVEQTVYYARVLSEHMPTAVALLADILQNSLLSAEELAREQQVIVQEIGMHLDSPDDYIGDIFDEVAYPKQAMGRSILGSAEQVQSYVRDDVERYMLKHYRAPRMVVSAAGKLSHQALLAEVEKHFTALNAELPEVTPEASRYAGGRKHEQKDIEQTHTMMGYEALPLGHPDFHALQLLASILGGGMSSRLFQEIREKRGLVYSVASYVAAYSDTGLLMMSAASSPTKAKEIPALMVRELEGMAKEVLESELARAKNQQMSDLAIARENTTAVASWLGRHLLVYGRVKSIEELKKNIQAVTTADITRLAGSMLQATPTLVSLGN